MRTGSSNGTASTVRAVSPFSSGRTLRPVEWTRRRPSDPVARPGSADCRRPRPRRSWGVRRRRPEAPRQTRDRPVRFLQPRVRRVALRVVPARPEVGLARPAGALLRARRPRPVRAADEASAASNRPRPPCRQRAGTTPAGSLVSRTGPLPGRAGCAAGRNLGRDCALRSLECSVTIGPRKPASRLSCR